MNMFSNPLVKIPISVYLIFLLAGYILYKFPPKNINGLYGYRTSNSMQNQERWDFAQTYAGKEMMKSPAVFGFFGVLGIFSSLNEITSVLISLSLVIIISIQVEKKLK